MAAYRPLVIIGGDVTQLPSGDTILGAAEETSLGSFQNDTLSAVPFGTPVYCSSAGKFTPARANAKPTAQVFALVRDASIGGSASGSLQASAFLSGTVSQWNAVTGGSSGLTPGANYFLSADTAGRLTTTPPSADGSFVVKIGQAITATMMAITISPAIGL